MHTTFLNCRLCINGQLVPRRLVVSSDPESSGGGVILPETGFIGGEAIDLEDGIIAPGFLELHANGAMGFHFSMYGDDREYEERLRQTARWYVTRGVTAFWATLPTVEKSLYKQILPCLRPSSYPRCASLMGAHVEGPYLAASKKGAHNATLFQSPSSPPAEVYGADLSSIKLITVAPELPGSASLIKTLSSQGVRVSLGHSAATYEEGLAALTAGATCLTHTLNAMTPLHHRAPGLAGLITLPQPPYYSILADGHHVHPAVAALLHRAAPRRSILVSDSLELTGLPDGTYPGHAQVPRRQVKAGVTATIEGTDTLVGACVTVDQCVRNLAAWAGCGVAEAVRCVTENVADFMGLPDCGYLTEGRRADFVVLSDDGDVLQTWIAGRKVWDSVDGYVEDEN